MPGTGCRGCGAEIVWARTEAGRVMPLDPRPYDADVVAANVAVFRGVDGQLRCRELSAERPLLPHERRAMPHWATCVAQLAQADRIPGVRSIARARARREGA